MRWTDMKIHFAPASTDAMEAAYAALHRDADSAQRRLREQPPPQRRRGTPRLWDASPIDPRPDDCWRCDAVTSADALGLCPDCRRDLACG
jgi:hypothetical protein